MTPRERDADAIAWMFRDLRRKCVWCGKRSNAPVHECCVEAAKRKAIVNLGLMKVRA